MPRRRQRLTQPDIVRFHGLLREPGRGLRGIALAPVCFALTRSVLAIWARSAVVLPAWHDLCAGAQLLSSSSPPMAMGIMCSSSHGSLVPSIFMAQIWHMPLWASNRARRRLAVHDRRVILCAQTLYAILNSPYNMLHVPLLVSQNILDVFFHHHSLSWPAISLVLASKLRLSDQTC